MKNTVTATIIFSFRGETFQPSVTLELDKYLIASGKLPDLYHIIAAANGFDHYSYEFEMMEAEPITFSEARGLVAEYVSEGVLDIEAFETAWQENRALEKVLAIAKQHMGIDDFSQHQGLKQALLEAYLSGQRDTH